MRTPIPLLLAVTALARADVVLSPANREVPGLAETCCLLYENPDARSVEVNGEWWKWAKPAPLRREGGRWTLDLAALRPPEGRHEFKFIVDGAYEAGVNRLLYVNARGHIQRRPDWILSARVEEPRRIEVFFRRPPPPGATVTARLDPALPVTRMEWPPVDDARLLRGFTVNGDAVSFLFDPSLHGWTPGPEDTVAVAGNFNGWNPRLGDWRLRAEGGILQLHQPLELLRTAAARHRPLLFKFVVNGERWLEHPAAAPNATRAGGDGATNLELTLDAAGAPRLILHTGADIDLTRAQNLELHGIAPEPLRQPLSPGRILDTFVSDLPMGATLHAERAATTYRVWSPRASSVHLNLCAGPRTTDPVTERHPLRREAGGTWSVTLPGHDTGRYYHFNIDGPGGDAEGFDGRAAAGDAWARAVAHAEGNAIVVDAGATNRWFTGWTDGEFEPPAPEDALIYETHVRHFTADPSSGVPPALRGTYEGFRTGRRGLDHLKAMGVNYIQFMPVGEFPNGTNRHDWGYATCFFFAPEASYGRAPLEGSQHHEFKRLVNDLHAEGFGVILDVVYNHVGDPNVFHYMDKKAFFRMNPDFTLSNFSGCGNDTRTEAPMFRRLIVENVLYWMREFHVDGFRFDLAELIDADTLREIEREARRLNPRVLLISEPWSFRGNHKAFLKGKSWSAWNDDFRETVKRFALGSGSRENLHRAVAGSTGFWTAHPLQAVNYLESHDDMALMDELSLRPDHDGRHLTAENSSVNRLAATVLFMSLGIPMLTEGQEFLRGKQGVRNTYDRGDALNAVRFTEADRPHARESLAYYRALSALRRSDDGASLRVRAAPDDYFDWINPPDERRAGWVMNARRSHPGAAFLVLVNAAPEAGAFAVDLPPGEWLPVSDGLCLDPAGLGPALTGGRSVPLTVSPRAAAIWTRR